MQHCQTSYVVPKSVRNEQTANVHTKDSAPDIYETPELTDDSSTAPVGAQ